MAGDRGRAHARSPPGDGGLDRAGGARGPADLGPVHRRVRGRDPLRAEGQAPARPRRPRARLLARRTRRRRGRPRRVPHAGRTRVGAAEGAAARPGCHLRRRQPAGRRDPVARPAQPAARRPASSPPTSSTTCAGRSAPRCATPSGTAARIPVTSPRTASAAVAARAAAPSSSGRRSAAGRRSGARAASRYDGPRPTCPGSAASSSSTAVASVGVSVTSASPAASTVHRPSSPSSTSRYQPVPPP